MLFNISNPQETNDFLPPSKAEIGVTGDVASSPGMVMGRLYIDPSTRSRRQFIVNADLALFVVRGSGNLITGAPHDSHTDTFEDKDFIFIESGEIFSIENSSNRSCAMIFVLVGEERLEDLNQKFVEPPNS